MNKKPKRQPESGEDSFEETAKRLECEDDKEAFEKKLGKIAKAAPKRGHDGNAK